MQALMKRVTYILMILVLCLLGTGCGDSGRFNVEGTLSDGRTTNLRYAYYNGSAFVQGITAARDGRFRFEGSSPQAALVELFDNDYRPLGCLYAANGDEIECVINPADPNLLQAKGRKDLERWTAWLQKHAEALASGADANVLVADYVDRHPDDVVSTLLLTTLFDASRPGAVLTADSLLNLIPAESRPLNLTQSLLSQIQMSQHSGSARVKDFRVRIPNERYDSLHIADEALWLFAFTSEQSGRRDSVVKALRDIHRYHGKRVRIVDISLDADTLAWRRITRPDSAKWTQGWLPGGTAAQGIDSLGLPRLPYFIYADSAGRQLLRTGSAEAATKFIDHRK